MQPTLTNKKTLDIRREVRRCPTCEQRFSRDAAFCPFDGVRLEESLVDPLSDPLIRARIDGRYDVIQVLGEGGMGRVYEVRHVALARSFAMKVLRPELAREEDLAERFIREATATASVKHPNVVQITDFGRVPDGTPYYVMDLLIGHTLAEVIKAEGPIPPHRAVRIVRKIAGALGAAHAAGVVHRDLKPENVFLVGGSRDLVAPADPERERSRAPLGYGADVRVVDFGASKIVGSSRVTRAGIVFGTPHYMSPEQASGEAVDNRADVYALGIIMYEMLAGRVPFEADTYLGVLNQHMFVQPVPPSQVAEPAKGLGPLEAITLRCLAKRPKDRFVSMEELIRALDEVVSLGGNDDAGPRLESSPSRAAGRVWRRRPDDSDLPSLAELRAGLVSDRPRQRRRPWVVALAGAGLAGAAFAAFIAVGWFRPGAPTRADDRGARGTPVPAEPAGPSPSVRIAAPPSHTVVEPVASGAPTVGEAASVSAPLPPQHKRRRDALPSGAVAPLDDVGDPFAGKP